MSLRDRDGETEAGNPCVGGSIPPLADPTYADPRGRMYYAAVRYAFR